MLGSIFVAAALTAGVLAMNKFFNIRTQKVEQAIRSMKA